MKCVPFYVLDGNGWRIDPGGELFAIDSPQVNVVVEN